MQNDNLKSLGSEWDYQIKAWIDKLRSFPIALVKSVSFTEGYSRCDAFLFKLENKKYALIIEEGCSCYSHEQAEIELFPNIRIALLKLNQWEKEIKRIKGC